MHHVRRLLAVVIGCATWGLAAATGAFAKGVPDPHPIVTSAAAPMWEFLAMVALGVLLAVAIVGLGYSLSRPRRSESSHRSRPVMHA